MNKIKVLHIYKTYYPESDGGVQRVIKSICNVSDGYVHRVLTASLNAKEIFFKKINKVKVTYIPSMLTISSTPLVNPFNKEIKREINWADLIVMHYPYPIADMILLNYLRNNQKLIILYHSDIIKQNFLKYIYLPVMFLTFKRADIIIATSKEYVKGSRVLKKYFNKVRIIPLCISDNEKKFLLGSHSKPKFLLPKKPYFLFIGIHRYYKGLKYFVKALSKTSYMAVIAGTGPETCKIKKLAKKICPNQIFFPGKISEKDKSFLLKDCFAFVLPSFVRSEAFGVCLLEAMCLKKALITSNISSGIKFVNKHLVTGITVAPKNINALKNAMDKLIKNPMLVRKLSIGSKKRFEEFFTEINFKNKFKKLFSNLAN